MRTPNLMQSKASHHRRDLAWRGYTYTTGGKKIYPLKGPLAKLPIDNCDHAEQCG